jgi:hypothetical protein
LNKNYKFGIILAAIGVVFLSAILFLYDNYSTEALYRRGEYTPFWTMLENSTEEVRIRQGETITIPVELHYWSGLKTLLGIQFEEPEAEQGGLYNPPDGLTILLEADGAFFGVDNGRIVDVLTHKDVNLPEPDRIEQHMEGNMVVAKVGKIRISVSDEVPAGDYYFGIKTTDANVGAVYEGNSQLLWIRVVEGR